MNKFEELYRALLEIEEILDNNENLSVRELIFADRVAIIAKRVVLKIEDEE